MLNEGNLGVVCLLEKRAMTFNTCLQFLALFVATGAALGIRPPAALAQTLNVTGDLLIPLNRDFYCFPGSRLSIRRLKFNECAAAILQLPSNQVTGTFHREGDNNQFRLPVVKYYGNCAVKVDIREGFSDEMATWLGLGVVAAHLNSACSNHFYGKRYKGGWTSAGDRDRVKISIKPRDGIGSARGNNHTLEAEEAFL